MATASTSSEFWHGLWTAIRAMWHSANYKVRHGAQVAALSIFAAFTLLLLAAMTGFGPLVALIALLILAVGVLLILQYPDPLIIVPIAFIPGIDKVWRALKSLLGAYFFIAIFLTIGASSVRNHWYYMPEIALTALGALYFQWIGWNARAVWAGALAIALVIYTRTDVLKKGYENLPIAQILSGNVQVKGANANTQPPSVPEFTLAPGEGSWTLPAGKVVLIIPEGKGETHWIARPQFAKKFTIVPSSDIYVQREWQETQHFNGDPLFVRHLEDWRPIPLAGLTEVSWAPVTRVRFNRNPHGAVRVTVECD